MLEFRKKRFGLDYRYKWFTERPSLASLFKPVYYMQCERPGPWFLGCVNRKITVWVVDLNQSEEEILAGMKPRTRTDIRRAARDGIEVDACADRERFLEFYNAFAKRKSEHLSRLDDQIHWGENTLVLEAHKDGDPLVMTHFVFDRAAGRARMLNSAAAFRGVSSSEQRNNVGRASRLLHYRAMLHFKQMGLRLYDFGEYDEDTKDESLAQVNRFKACFGGGKEECYKFQTLPMYAFSRMNGIARKLAG